MLALLICLLQPDWTEVRQEAEEALKTEERVARRHAVELLSAHDRRESAQYLLKLYAVSTALIVRAEAEIEKVSREAKPARAKMPSAKDLMRQQQQMLKDMRAGKPLKPPSMGKPKRLKELPGPYGVIAKERALQDRIVLALAKLKDPKVLKALHYSLEHSKSWPERFASAEVLGRMEDASAVGPLRKRLTAEKDPRVMVAVIDALVRLKDTGSVEALGKLLKTSGDWQVQVAAAHAIAELGDRSAIPYLIEALRKADGRLREEINSALAKLSGVNKHGNEKAWKDWWEAHKEAILAGTYEPPKGEPTGRGATRITFYGIPVTSKNVIFVLDVSGSMKQPAGWKPDPEHIPTKGRKKEIPEEIGDRKIDVALYELKRAIKALPEDTRFNLIFYSDGYKVWKEDEMPKASKANKKSALKFVEEVEPDGGTNFFESLERAFLTYEKRDKDRRLSRMRGGADTIYMLSDGQPTVGRLAHPDDIRKQISEMNRERGITIHTIAVGKEVDRDFMKQLAEENGGTFVHFGK